MEVKRLLLAVLMGKNILNIFLSESMRCCNLRVGGTFSSELTAGFCSKVLTRTAAGFSGCNHLRLIHVETVKRKQPVLAEIHQF